MNAQRMHQCGMTLVEVLVAMAILAGIAGSVMLMTAQSARLGLSVEQKSLARIVADNTAVATLATSVRLERRTVTSVEFAGQEWRVQRTVNDAGIEGVAHITVSVLLNESDQVLARIETLKVQQE